MDRITTGDSPASTTGRYHLHRRTWFRTISGFVLTGIGGAVYSTRIEPALLDVREVQVALPNLDAAFTSYRLIQLSDIHIDGDWMDRTRLATIVEHVNAQTPDLVVLTGDFVTGPLHPDLTMIMGELRGIVARDGVFAVLGNHDHWTDANLVAGLVEQQDVAVLRDAIQIVRRGDASLHIAGMDGVWQSRDYLLPLEAHRERLDTLAAQINDGEAAIMLVHEPDIADMVAATQRFGLQLSGHSHGGQIRVPFSGAILLPPLGQTYPMGLSQVGSMLQYTNRGAGMISPQVRFNCRPEITVFTLTMA